MLPGQTVNDLAFRVAELERKLANVVRPGRIAAVDTERTRVRVAYDVDDDDEAITTTWLPWLTARAGTVLTWSAPSLGEQVLLLSPVGDLAQAFVLPAIYQIPLEPPDDPHVHALLLPAGDKLVIEGNVEVLGDVVSGSGRLADRLIGRVSLRDHVHGVGPPPNRLP